MIVKQGTKKPILALILLTFLTSVGCYRDSIVLNGTLRDEEGDTLVSEGKRFELGFFRMNETKGSYDSRYIGVWYYRLSPKTIVWVANRENPVGGSGGVFSVTEDGGIRMSDSSGKKSYWLFGGNETAVNTKRVVGTLGYISPKYAIDSIFLDKSDVFSFGMVLLEVLSGQRNSGFIPSGTALSLLGQAWLLWNERNALEFVDSTIRSLCIQEDPSDRPTISRSIFMLGSETATLPSPKQPAFLSRRCPSSRTSSSGKIEPCSHNGPTITMDNGRQHSNRPDSGA